jgi:hypothetical protein
MEGVFIDGENPLEEPERWRPPAACPQCRQTRTRFVELHYEMSVYECELCGIRFEVEEDG